MKTYMGFTRNQLVSYFDYEMTHGTFTRKRDGKRLIDYRYDCRNPDGERVSLYLNRVALIIVDGEFLDGDTIVKFKDGNRYNLSYENLVVVKKSEDNLPTDDYKFVETATRGVFYNHTTKMFVVRRGKKQAIYRTFNYNEAVLVRKEWEKDKTIHRWDYSVPSWLKDTI